MPNRLALGTVQFGLAYGIANQGGRVSLEDAGEILAQARAGGIDTLDTAIAYGDSEDTLGRLGVDGWRIVSKLPGIPADTTDIGAWVRGQMRQSLQRLGVSRLHAVLLHRPDELLGPQGPALWDALGQLKADGLAGKIGVSIYGPEELDRLYDGMHFDLVQAPLNVLDRRLVTSGWAARLHAQGVELHLRSAFLQGLLLMAPAERPAKFARWAGIWAAWDAWLAGHGLTPLQACLRHALSISEADRIVFGVDHPRQLQEILQAAQGSVPALPEWPQPVDSDLITPARWNQL